MAPNLPELTPETPRIGPFALFDVIGAAGMGVVWRAMHVEQRIPVAIKFLTADGARDPLYLGCLKNEVRKVAALDHPAIVQVHDHGSVPEDLGIKSLVPGSPYLVMEYAEGGTLSRHCGNLDWAQTYRVLMRLLGSLAHAHSHGVVHRDLKPGNVLLRRATGGVMLTDFGLARAGDTDGGAVLNAGTPSYMAPEQIEQRGSDIGPWTDMYALGCLAWSLLSGTPPFHRDSIDETLTAHLAEPVPNFEPNKPVPVGAEGWIQQLLHKSPHQRFVRASDAIFALQKLAPSDDIDTLHTEPVFQSSVTMDRFLESTAPATSSADDTQVMDPRTISGRQTTPAPLPQVERSLLWVERDELPPMPADWRPDYPHRSVAHLLGTGLAMFGMRSFPLVGREHEQNELWTTLETVRSTPCTRIVVIEGADGMGKSHLANWVARRSYEVGSAIALRAQFQDSSSHDPLVGLLHSLLSTTGNEREEAKTRVEQALEVLGHYQPQEVDALLAVLGPFPGEKLTKEATQERNEIRVSVIRRILHRFSVLRPIVLLLDDVHFDEEALQFASMLLAKASVNHPIMCVLTVNPVTATSGLKRALEQLKEHEAVSSIQLGPLAKEHRSELVRKLLGLEPDLASLVERRSGGNPQFAVQLMGDWIQKDILVHSNNGFNLKPGVRPEFPSDLQAVWERRLAAALPPFGDTRCLQVAAELGMEFSQEEWETACGLLQTEADMKSIAALVESQLLVPKPKDGEWMFVHSLVREALRRQADFEGNRQKHHRAVATMLAGRERVAHRRGRHLFLASDFGESIDVLLDGAWQCFREARNEIGWDLVLLRERALGELKIPKEDIRWANGWLAKERFYARRKMFPDVLKTVELILTHTTETPGAEHVRAMAWFRKGTIHRLMAEPDRARDALNKAMEIGINDIEVTWRTLEQMGSLELMFGNLSTSEEFFEGALKAAMKTGMGDQVFQVRQNMAGVFRRTGDIEAAKSHLSAALDYYRKTGAKRLQSRCLNDLAELDRFTGDLERAEDGYRQALTLLEALGDQQFYVAALNLGAIYAETGRPVEARNQLEHCARALKGSGLMGIEGATHLFLAHVHAQLGLMENWRSSFDEGFRLVTTTGFADVDIARSTRLGGQELLANGYRTAALESLRFSHEHWVLLDRSQEAAEVGDLIAELEDAPD